MVDIQQFRIQLVYLLVATIFRNLQDPIFVVNRRIKSNCSLVRSSVTPFYPVWEGRATR